MARDFPVAKCRAMPPATMRTMDGAKNGFRQKPSAAVKGRISMPATPPWPPDKRLQLLRSVRWFWRARAVQAPKPPRRAGHKIRPENFASTNRTIHLARPFQPLAREFGKSYFALLKKSLHLQHHDRPAEQARFAGRSVAPKLVRHLLEGVEDGRAVEIRFRRWKHGHKLSGFDSIFQQVHGRPPPPRNRLSEPFKKIGEADVASPTIQKFNTTLRRQFLLGVIR